MIISNLFKDVSGPKFYIEIGANDGVSQSNTKYLELFYDWRGILIEPIPSVFKKLQKIVLRITFLKIELAAHSILNLQQWHLFMQI